MPTFKQIIEYLKDNPNNYWFKRKLYGWGWVPVTWQGWLSIVFFAAVIAVCAFVLGDNPSDSAVWIFLIEEFVAVAALLFVCYKKGEKPKWQWGLPKDKAVKGE